VGPSPSALVAVTLNVYAVPLVRPVTVTSVPAGAPVTVAGVWAVVPMNGVTVYFVIVLPPLSGAVHRTVALSLPGLAGTAGGASGIVAGVTASDGSDSGPVPIAFVAVTTNV